MRRQWFRLEGRTVTLQAAELLLWAIAGLSFMVLAWARVNAVHAQHLSQAFLASGEPGHRAQPSALAAPLGSDDAARVIGRLEIAALHLDVPITAGVEQESLLQGVGHMHGTALPGGLGTMVLAGHRDTYLRPLAQIHTGMDIRVTEGEGIFHYTVDRWEIVHPEDVESIAITNRPELALVTCYPFHYVGPAPMRFIVHAHLNSLLPDRSPAAPGY